MTLLVPKYCRQKRRGKADSALVIIDGRRISLGEYGYPASRAWYAELINRPAEGPHASASIARRQFALLKPTPKN